MHVFRLAPILLINNLFICAFIYILFALKFGNVFIFILFLGFPFYATWCLFIFKMSDDERRIDRSIIGAKLIRRLSLRPTAEELEDRNILKSKFSLCLFSSDHLLYESYPFVICIYLSLTNTSLRYISLSHTHSFFCYIRKRDTSYPLFLSQTHTQTHSDNYISTGASDEQTEQTMRKKDIPLQKALFQAQSLFLCHKYTLIYSLSAEASDKQREEEKEEKKRYRLRKLSSGHIVCLSLTYTYALIYSLSAEASDKQREEEKEEKKRYLLRKLSFRPSVDELKNRKVHFIFFDFDFLRCCFCSPCYHAVGNVREKLK